MACETAPWELSKENVMPIIRGRDVQKLNDKLSERPKGMRERSTVLEQERGAFEERVSRAKDESDDPIKEWIRYINWQQASCPSDGHAALLLLERCAREFQDDPRYKNDPRYLKVWIAYADRLVSPGDIFKYLHKRRVGTGLSLFWAAWAFIAEKQRNFALADKLYNKGVEVSAVPVELMAERRRHFQRRMARHWVTLQQEQDAAGEAGGPTTRAALSQTRARTRVVNGVRSNVPVGTSTATAYRDNQPVGASVPIFLDPDLQPPPSSSTNRHAQSQSHRFLDEENDPGAAGWKDVGREADRRKENEMTASQWVGAPVPSQSTARHVNHQKQQARSGAFVPIFVDQEFQGQPPPHTHSGVRTPQGGVLTPHNRSFENSANTSTDKVKKPLAPRTERVCGEVERLVKQPLKNFEASTGSSQAAAAAASGGGGRGPTITTTTSKGKGLFVRGNVSASDRTPPPPKATTTAPPLAGSGGSGGGDDGDDDDGGGSGTGGGGGGSTGGGGGSTGGGGAATSPAAPDTHLRATATPTPTATRGSSHTRPRPTPTRTPAPTTTTTTTHRRTPQQPLDTTAAGAATSAATTTPTTRRIIAPHPAATNVNHGHHHDHTTTANANSASVSASDNHRVVAVQSWKDDMTINTRFALADVDAMFGTPTHGCEGALDSPLMQSAPTSRSSLPGSAASGGGGGFTIFTDDSDHQHAHGSHSRTAAHTRASDAHTPMCADTHAHAHTGGRGDGGGGGGGGALQGFSIFSDEEEAGAQITAPKRPPSKPAAPATGGLGFTICADEVTASTEPPARHQAKKPSMGAGASGSGSCRAKPQGGFSGFSDADEERSYVSAAAPVKARTKLPSASGFGIFSDDGVGRSTGAAVKPRTKPPSAGGFGIFSDDDGVGQSTSAPVKARTKPPSASGFSSFSDDGVGQSSGSAPVKAKVKPPSSGSGFGIFSDDGVGQSASVPVKAKSKPSSTSSFSIFSDDAAAAPVKAKTKLPSASGFSIFSDDAGGNGGARSSKPASGAFAVFSDIDGQQTSGGALAPTRKKAMQQNRGSSKPKPAFAIFNEDDDDHEGGKDESSPSPPARALTGLRFDLSGGDDEAKGDGDEPDHLLRFGGLELSGIPEEDSANMTRSNSIRAHTTTLPTFPSDLSPVAPLSHSTRRSFSIHHDDM